jgi:hypothetical protein
LVSGVPVFGEFREFRSSESSESSGLRRVQRVSVFGVFRVPVFGEFNILDHKSRKFIYHYPVSLSWSFHLRILCMFYLPLSPLTFATYATYIIFFGISSSFCMQMDFSAG